MTISQFLFVLRARWRIASFVFLLIVGLVVGLSLVLPKKYQASASVLIDFRPDPITAALYGGGAPPALLATQVDIIKSARVAERVVRNLNLTGHAGLREQWRIESKGEGAFENWLAALFQRNMDVLPSRESSVISIQYSAGDPKFAAALANAFVQAYIDVALELRVDPARKYSTFFDTRAQEARDDLEKKQALLSSFQKANGIIASDERFDIGNTRLNELSSQLTLLQAISAESSSRQAQAQGGQGDRMQEVLSNPLIASLKADFGRAESRLQEISTRLGENHPQVQEARASSQELRGRLETEIRRVTGGVTVSNTINRQRLAEVKAALDAQRASVLRMKAVRDEGAVLQRDVESAQRAYDTMLQRFNQTSLEGQTTQSNVNELTKAVPPLRPSSPNILLNTVLAVIGGALLAAGSAIGFELRDKRVRTYDDVVQALDLPVIGSMPKPNAKIAFTKKSPLMQQRLVSPRAGKAEAA